MKHLFALIMILGGGIITARAQEVSICDTLKLPRQGTVTVIADTSLDRHIFPEVVVEPVNGDEEEPGMQGYRIQIYGGSDRNEAQKIMRELQTLYPELPSYFSYESPYFKVRVGDFRSKVEAQKWLHELKEIYKGVLLVPTKINFPELGKKKL